MLQGDIKNMPGTELLQVLSQGGHDGCFVVENKDLQRRIFISGEGNILYVESNAPKEKLGFLLTQMSLVTETNLAKLRELEQSSGSKTASLLLKKELVTPKDLGACIKHQFRTVLTSILAMKKGKFYFHDGEKPPNSVLKIKISMQSLLLTCVTLSDQQAHLISQLGGENTIYGRVSDQRKQVTLSPVELDILISAENGMTVRDYLDRIAHPDIEILKALSQMSSGGLLANQGSKELKAKEFVADKHLISIKKALVDQIGPMGEFLLTEAVEKIGDDSGRVDKEDWAILVDLLMQELEPEDRKKIQIHIGETP